MIYSPYTDWIRQLDIKFVRGCDDGLDTVIEWATKRGSSFRCLGYVAYCIERVRLGEDPVVSHAKLRTWLRQEDMPGQELKEEVSRVLGRFWTLAKSSEHNAAFKKTKVSPVEFIYFSKFRSLSRRILKLQLT